MHPSVEDLQEKLSSFLFLVLCFACVSLAEHFNIFSVFPTKSKARRGIETTKVADLEFGGDDTVGGGERSAAG